jgi:hypothetical protein
MTGPPGRAGGEKVWLYDGIVLLWVAAWIVVGVLVGIDLHHLDRLTVTLDSSGQALSQTAQALQGLIRLPLVGSHLAKIATSIAATGRSVQANASTTRSSVNQLSYLVALAIAIIPSVPVLAAYLPRRMHRHRLS